MFLSYIVQDKHDEFFEGYHSTRAAFNIEEISILYNRVWRSTLLLMEMLFIGTFLWKVITCWCGWMTWISTSVIFNAHNSKLKSHNNKIKFTAGVCHPKPIPFLWYNNLSKGVSFWRHLLVIFGRCYMQIPGGLKIDCNVSYALTFFGPHRVMVSTSEAKSRLVTMFHL